MSFEQLFSTFYKQKLKSEKKIIDVHFVLCGIQ